MFLILYVYLKLLDQQHPHDKRDQQEHDKQNEICRHLARPHASQPVSLLPPLKARSGPERPAAGQTGAHRAGGC